MSGFLPPISSRSPLESLEPLSSCSLQVEAEASGTRSSPQALFSKLAPTLEKVYKSKLSEKNVSFPCEETSTQSMIHKYAHLIPRYHRKPRTSLSALHSPRNFSSPVLLSSRVTFSSMTPNFGAFCNKNVKFKKHDASQEIIQCLEKNPKEGRTWALKQLITYHDLPKGRQLLDRWERLIVTLFLSSACVPLIHDLVKKIDPDFSSFPEFILKKLLSKNTDASQIAHIFSLYTQEDLQEQVLETLFREISLSSRLYTLYGKRQLRPFLNSLEVQILSSWKSTGLADFQQFATDFLRFFYGSSPLSKESQSLFSMRRTKIYQKLKDQFSQEEASRQSETFIGEILFLRIINPFILKITADLKEGSCFINLIKVMQSLSNQIPPKNQPPSFQKIYEEFLPIHRRYIGDNCPLCLDPEASI